MQNHDQQPEAGGSRPIYYVGAGPSVARSSTEQERAVRTQDGAWYARKELIDQSSRMLYRSQEEFEAAGKDWYEQIRIQGVGTVEARWRRQDGAILPVLINSSPLNPEIPDEGATLTILDLSSRKRAAEQAKASEEHYRQLFDTMAEGVGHDARSSGWSKNPQAKGGTRCRAAPSAAGPGGPADAVERAGTKTGSRAPGPPD